MQSCESFVLYKHSLRNPQPLGKFRSPKVTTASGLVCGQERWGSVVTTHRRRQNQFKILFKYQQIKMLLLIWHYVKSLGQPLFYLCLFKHAHIHITMCYNWAWLIYISSNNVDFFSSVFWGGGRNQSVLSIKTKLIVYMSISFIPKKIYVKEFGSHDCGDWKSVG